MSSELLSNKYKQALDLVAVLFKDEKRKITDVPYVVHLVGVAHIVEQSIDDEPLVIAALLHDVLEDIPSDRYSESDMTKDFGERITEIVKTVTHDEERDGLEGSRSSYLRQIREGSQDACLISAADLLYNLKDSINTYKEHPTESERLFKGDRAMVRRDFYIRRFDVLRSRLGAENSVIKSIETEIIEFKNIYDEILVK